MGPGGMCGIKRPLPDGCSGFVPRKRRKIGDLFGLQDRAIPFERGTKRKRTDELFPQSKRPRTVDPQIQQAYQKRMRHIQMTIEGTCQAINAIGLEPNRVQKLQVLIGEVTWMRQNGYADNTSIQRVLITVYPLLERNQQLKESLEPLLRGLI